MSNEHKRWNPQLEQYYKGVNKTPSYRPKMMLDITGRYVLESDYAALINRNEELEYQLNQERKAHEKDIYVWQDNYASLEAKLTKVVEALKEAGDVIESYYKNTRLDLGDVSRMPFYKDTIKLIDDTLAELKGKE